jgi:uncharacterized membrane protein
MATVTVRAREKDNLAEFLGWFSMGLGTAEVTAPKAMCKVVGADPAGAAPRVMRLMGLRELLQGVGILSSPRPTKWLWLRVAGDGLDLSLLGLAAARHPDRRGRAAFAIANVLAVTVPDVLESLHLARKQGSAPRAMRIRKAVTINRPPEQVEAAWLGAEELRQEVERAGAHVSFTPAPGGRGTELAVEFDYDPPAGDLGGAVAKLSGRDLPTELADGLRRFKQVVETGEIVRSDSTPEGHLLVRHLKQRPAQPLAEVAR